MSGLSRQCVANVAAMCHPCVTRLKGWAKGRYSACRLFVTGHGRGNTEITRAPPPPFFQRFRFHTKGGATIAKSHQLPEPNPSTLPWLRMGPDGPMPVQQGADLGSRGVDDIRRANRCDARQIARHRRRGTGHVPRLDLDVPHTVFPDVVPQCLWRRCAGPAAPLPSQSRWSRSRSRSPRPSPPPAAVRRRAATAAAPARPATLHSQWVGAGAVPGASW